MLTSGYSIAVLQWIQLPLQDKANKIRQEWKKSSVPPLSEELLAADCSSGGKITLISEHSFWHATCPVDIHTPMCITS